MKLTAWLLPALAPLTAVSVLAQASNSLPPALQPAPPEAAAAPAASTNAAPAKPKAKHHKPKAKPAAEKKQGKEKSKEAKEAKTAKPAATNSTIVLNPPVTAVVKCNVLDVRGQGSFGGEIITYAKKGENVTVLEEITLGHPHSGEPAQWSKIMMPVNTAVWVSAQYIDPDMSVRAKKVNVRGGPGENYSVIARLDKGTVVKEIGKKEGWLEIASPTNAIAYVASQYLETAGPATPAQELAAAPAPAPAPAPAAPPPAPVVVNVPAEPAPPAPAKAPEPASTGLTAPAPTAASQTDQELAAHKAPEPAPAAPAPVAMQGEPGKPDSARIVTREGFVHHALNIQAPAGYELHDIKTGTLTEYLQPAPGQKSFKAFVGTRVRLTGSEFLDPEWPRTPVLHVETVDLMP